VGLYDNSVGWVYTITQWGGFIRELGGVGLYGRVCCHRSCCETWVSTWLVDYVIQCGGAWAYVYLVSCVASVYEHLHIHVQSISRYSEFLFNPWYQYMDQQLFRSSRLTPWAVSLICDISKTEHFHRSGYKVSGKRWKTPQIEWTLMRSCLLLNMKQWHVIVWRENNSWISCSDSCIVHVYLWHPARLYLLYLKTGDRLSIYWYFCFYHLYFRYHDNRRPLFMMHSFSCVGGHTAVYCQRAGGWYWLHHIRIGIYSCGERKRQQNRRRGARWLSYFQNKGLPWVYACPARVRADSYTVDTVGSCHDRLAIIMAGIIPLWGYMMVDNSHLICGLGPLTIVERRLTSKHCPIDHTRPK